MIKKCANVKLCILWTMKQGESYNLKVIKCMLVTMQLLWLNRTHRALMDSGCSVLKGTYIWGVF